MALSFDNYWDEQPGTRIFSCTFCDSLGHGDVNYLAGFHCITLKMFFVYNQLNPTIMNNRM